MTQTHVLFLCVANSARSQMAEGLARRIFPARVQVSSAGSQPGRLNPFAARALAELGIDISAHWSKSVEQIDQASVNTVITLCAEEVCPMFPRQVEKLHWALPDPAAVEGSDADRLAEFCRIRDEIQRRLMAFAQTRFPDSRGKVLDIEWRHLDSDGQTCCRCSDTGAALKEALAETEAEWARQGITVRLKEVCLKAEQISESNLILVNGKPLETYLPVVQVVETDCPSCATLIGKASSCRALNIQGEMHEGLSKDLILKALVKSVREMS